METAMETTMETAMDMMIVSTDVLMTTAVLTAAADSAGIWDGMTSAITAGMEIPVMPGDQAEWDHTAPITIQMMPEDTGMFRTMPTRAEAFQTETPAAAAGRRYSSTALQQ
jgi:hypothetical protein